MINYKSKYFLLSIIIIIIIIIGFFIGVWCHKEGKFESFFYSEELPFVDLDVQHFNQPRINKSSYIELKNKLVDLIEDKKTKSEITNASIYFRDLRYGPTMGINEYEKFVPASLLKLPVMLTYLGLAEDEPEFLNKKLRYYKTGTSTIEQVVLPTKLIEEDTPYTIYELLERMMNYSDNRAYYVLLQYLINLSPNENLVERTIRDLGIIEPQDEWQETITTKSYASIFVQLYYASFFAKKETANLALQMMSNSDFHSGLEAGVPKYIKVAHKFGERSFSNSTSIQFHDCGIVYFPNNPYLLCVMTSGTDEKQLMNFIATVSKMFWEELQSRKL